MRWSVVVCTFNRGNELKHAIERLTQLDSPGDSYEIIIVDNGSTDSTGEIVRSVAETSPNIVSIREDRIGLSYARNAGIRAAKGEFVAFIDDDARPDSSWLVKLEEGFRNPRVACAGGKVEPFFEDIPGWPEWLHNRLYGFFTVVDYGSRRVLRYPDYPAGTNMAFRRTIFDQAGFFFRQELGRTGESLLSMEETDLCLRVENAGFSIEYLPEAIVHHKVRKERLSREWLRQRSYWQGVSAAVIEKSFSGGHIALKSLKYVVFLAAALIGSIGCRLLNKEKEALFFDCQSELCRGYLGKIWRSWGNSRVSERNDNS